MHETHCFQIGHLGLFCSEVVSVNGPRCLAGAVAMAVTSEIKTK